MIDFDNLAQEFNTGSEFNMDNFEQAAIDIEKALEGQANLNPDKILSDNIGRANAILDRLIFEINRTGMSPRLGEVAGQLIANINTAAGQLYGKDSDISNLQIKHSMLKLKERELELKEKVALQNRPGTINNNLIVTDRESILKFLSENKGKTKLLEDKSTEEDEK
jgi:hypothetical protein